MRKYKIKMKCNKEAGVNSYRWFYAKNNPNNKDIAKMHATFEEGEADKYSLKKAEEIKAYFKGEFPNALIEIIEA